MTQRHGDSQGYLLLRDDLERLRMLIPDFEEQVRELAEAEIAAALARS